MVQRGEHGGFALKAGQPFRIIHEVCGKDFDGYLARELGVVLLIYFAHPARANLRDDFVRSEFRASSEHHLFSFAGQFRTRGCRSPRLMSDFVPPPDRLEWNFSADACKPLQFIFGARRIR